MGRKERVKERRKERVKERRKERRKEGRKEGRKERKDDSPYHENEYMVFCSCNRYINAYTTYS